MKKFKAGTTVCVNELHSEEVLFIKEQFINNRHLEAKGKVIASLPGNGFIFWIIQHEDGTYAPYSSGELIECD